MHARLSGTLRLVLAKEALGLHEKSRLPKQKKKGTSTSARVFKKKQRQKQENILCKRNACIPAGCYGA